MHFDHVSADATPSPAFVNAPPLSAYWDEKNTNDVDGPDATHLTGGYPWAVQGQVEPGMTGLGADMFVLIYLAKTGEVKFINGTGFAAKAATIDFYKSKGGMPDDGPLSISVPGAVGGAALAVQKYGTKPLAEVFAPAIEIAEQGFPITDALAKGLSGSRAKLAKFPSTTKIWFRNGKPLERRTPPSRERGVPRLRCVQISSKGLAGASPVSVRSQPPSS